jgi:hypothetical protein
MLRNPRDFRGLNPKSFFFTAAELCRTAHEGQTTTKTHELPKPSRFPFRREEEEEKAAA